MAEASLRKKMDLKKLKERKKKRRKGLKVIYFFNLTSDLCIPVSFEVGSAVPQ